MVINSFCFSRGFRPLLEGPPPPSIYIYIAYIYICIFVCVYIYIYQCTEVTFTPAPFAVFSRAAAPGKPARWKSSRGPARRRGSEVASKPSAEGTQALLPPPPSVFFSPPILGLPLPFFPTSIPIFVPSWKLTMAWVFAQRGGFGAVFGAEIVFQEVLGCWRHKSGLIYCECKSNGFRSIWEFPPPPKHPPF